MGYGRVPFGHLVCIVGEGHPVARFLPRDAGEAVVIIDISPHGSASSMSSIEFLSAATKASGGARACSVN